MRVIENKSVIKYYGSPKELKTVYNRLLHTYSKYQLYKDEKSVSLCKGVLKRVTSKYEINITASLVRAKSIYNYWKSLGYTKVKYKQTNSEKFIIKRNNKKRSLRDSDCVVSKNTFLLKVNALEYYKSVSNIYTQSEMYYDKGTNTYYVIHTNFLKTHKSLNTFDFYDDCKKVLDIEQSKNPSIKMEIIGTVEGFKIKRSVSLTKSRKGSVYKILYTLKAAKKLKRIWNSQSFKDVSLSKNDSKSWIVSRS